MPLQFGPPIRTDYFASTTTQVTTLREGDYSCRLDNDQIPLDIRLERKSLSDLYGCLGQHRDRFEAELKRLHAYHYRGIILEASLNELTHGYHRSQISPRVALGSLCAWSVRHHLAVWFAENHTAAAAIAQRSLEAFAIEALRREAARCPGSPSTVTQDESSAEQ